MDTSEPQAGSSQSDAPRKENRGTTEPDDDGWVTVTSKKKK